VLVLALLVCAFGAVSASPVRTVAAMEIVLTASPASPTVGEPFEVLIRTFVPYGADLGLDLRAPRTPFPVASGYWTVLYAFPGEDYPFKVEATGPRGETTPIVVSRDPQDASLYRGVATLTAAGRWRIQVLNAANETPGSWVEVDVREINPSPEPEPASMGTSSEPVALVTAALGGLGGLILGFAYGRRRRPPAVLRP
jgi:hypothetical protein